MKVLERSTTPDGIKIQIEDWSDDYSFHRFADTVAAYPIFRDEKREYRASERFENASAASEAFYSLQNGTKTLDDYGFTSMSKGKRIPYKEYIPFFKKALTM